MGAVTGKGLGDLIRERFGLKLTVLVFLVLIIANLAVTISEFAGIAASGEMFGISRYILVPLCAILILVLMVNFEYKHMEKVFLFLALFYATYIISGFMAAPDWSLVGESLITPTFSFHPLYLILLIGIIGTTITPWMQFYLQSSIVEKGIKISDYRYSKWDVIIGCIITDVVAAFIIIAVAFTLHPAGIGIEAATDAARALEPLAGSFAKILFGFGFFTASFFGAAILPLATSFQLCEGIGWESGINKRFREAPQFYIIMAFLIIASAALILIPGINLIFAMLISQVINGIVLPVILIFMLILVNDKKIMKSYTNGRIYNIIAWGASGIIILLSAAMAILTFFPAAQIW